jgi:hypothetical protein
MARTDDLSLREPHHTGDPAAAARFESLAAARDAIERLEGHGVDGDDLVLAGWRARATASSQRRVGADGRLVRYVGRKTLGGIVLGGVLGTLVGAALGAAMAVIWPDTFDRWWPPVAIGAFFLSGLGALLGAFFQVERHVGFSEAWTLTLQDVPDGSIWVLLFDGSLSARAALEATQPAEIRTAESTRSAPDEREVRGLPDAR